MPKTPRTSPKAASTAPRTLSPRLIAAGVVLLAVVVVALAAVSLLAGGGESSSQGGEAVAPASPILDGVPQDGLVLGEADAPVTLVEYADLQCPFCAQWAQEAFPTVVDEYVRTGRVKLVFSGMAFIGPESELGLRAALAAAEQDRLWNLVHVLFENQGGENSGWLTEDSLRRLAGSIEGLDVDRLLDELGSAEVDDAIVAAAERASMAGIRSTPSFQAGRSGGELGIVRVSSLDAAGIRPRLDELLAE